MAFFEELDASLTLDAGDFISGAKRSASAADDVGDEADDAAGGVAILGGAFSGLAGSAATAISPTREAADAIDDAGDEALESTAAFGSLSASSDGLRLSMGAISGSISSVVVGIGGLLAVLAPLIPVLGLAAGAVTGLAAAFGAILGSGILAFGSARAKQNKEQLKQVKKKISRLEALEDTEKGLTKTQEKQLAALEEQAKKLEEGTTAMGGFTSALKEVGKELKPVIVQFGQQFAPLIGDLLNSIVPFTKSLLNAVGNLKPFTSALRALGGAAAQILPKLLEMFVNLARQSLPVFRQIGNFIAANLIPTLRALFQAGQQAAGPVARLGMALFELGKSLAPVAGIIGRVVLSLYDLAAVGVGGVAAGITAVVNAIRQGVAIFRQFGATIRSAVMPVLAQLATAWQGQGARIISVARGMGQQIMESLGVQFRAAAGIARSQLVRLSALWQTHGAAIATVLSIISRNLSEALISGMAAVASAVQGDLLQMRTMFAQGKAALLNIWRLLWAQAPAPVRAAMKLVAGAVRANIQQIRTAITAARGIWIRHGAAIRGFATKAIAALRQFGVMVRTAIARPIATFRALRAELNKMLPPFLRIQTTATQLGNAIKTKLLPALAATGLLGIATTLAPILSGVLLPALTRLSGVGLRLATLFGGPVVAALRILLSPLLRLGTLITGTLLPAFVSIASTVGGVLLSVLTSIGSLVGGVILSAFTTLSGLLSGGLLASLAGLATSLTSISGIMGILGAAISALLSPIGLLVVAVGALYVAWKTNLFGIRDIGMKVFGAIKSLISGDMMAAKNQFKQAVRMMGLSWTQNIKPLIADAKRIFGIIKQVVGDAMDWLYTNAVQPVLRSIKQLWQRHGQNIISSVKQLFNFLKTAFKVGVGALIVFWREFGDEILAVTKFIFDLVGSAIKTALDVIITTFDVVTDLLAGDWESALNKIADLATRIFNGIINFITKWGSALLTAIGNAAQWAWQRIHKFGVDVWNTITKFFGNVVSYLQNDFWGDLTGAIDSAARAGWQRIHKFGKDSLNAVQQFFGDIISYFQNDFVDDVVAALSQAAEDAVQAFKDAFNNAMPDKIGLPKTTVAGHTVGGGSINLPQLAAGGIATGPTAAIIGEGGENEVVQPLSHLESMLTNARESGGSGTQNVAVTLSVEGDSELADMIRRNIEANEQTKDRAIDRARSSFGAGGG